ncbi:MAG: alcohol dehydrogenase catalytic domain-containing protein, partial [Pseudomonadota bacterium]
MTAAASPMPVIEMRESGGAAVLVLGERPAPQPGLGELVIAVAAAGVNGPDIMQRRGLYPPPPGASDLLGLEVSGHVSAVGESVTGWSIGDPVCALTNGGGYAAQVAVLADHCLPVPDGVSLVDAAGLPETYFTVWSNLFMSPPRPGNDHGVGPDMTVLIHGGAGGIGSTTIQLCKAFGATVVATESPAERCQFCADLG